MKNSYKLIWSDEAISELKAIVDYLERKFSEKDVQKFAQKLDKQLKIICKNPDSFPFTNKSKGVRRTIIAKLTSVYFQVENNNVQIVSVFDNRKRPSDLFT